MIQYRCFCDCCGKEIADDNKGYFKLHYHAWSGGSIGGEEDEHHYECKHLCIECVGKIEKVIKDLGIEKEYKFDEPS